MCVCVCVFLAHSDHSTVATLSFYTVISFSFSGVASFLFFFSRFPRFFVYLGSFVLATVRSSSDSPLLLRISLLILILQHPPAPRSSVSAIPSPESRCRRSLSRARLHRYVDEESARTKRDHTSHHLSVLSCSASSSSSYFSPILSPSRDRVGGGSINARVTLYKRGSYKYVEEAKMEGGRRGDVCANDRSPGNEEGE